MNFKYAHLADLHLGAWRDEKMRALSTKAFLTCIDECLKEQVDFILFAGDLFNTSLPAIDTLKLVTEKLKELKDKAIPIYVIAGSHDFSPSGKTMIEVLEKAGLVHNVCRGFVNKETQELHLNFTTEQKTGAKITGILGRKGQLDQAYYSNLHRANLESEPGYKIFMFHTTVAELLPKELSIIESTPLSFFPKGFNYYAGGHIHHPAKVKQPENGYKCVTYPGALFPNNFAEVEKYGNGGYYLIECMGDKLSGTAQSVEWKKLEVINTIPCTINCSAKSPEVITYEILKQLEDKDIKDSLITIRLKGSLTQGRVSDINFKEVFTQLYDKGAYFIMKNTAKLHNEEFEEIKLAQNARPETIEEETIKEHLAQTNTFEKETEHHIIKSLLTSLNTTKKEGENLADFSERVKKEVEEILKVKVEHGV